MRLDQFLGGFDVIVVGRGVEVHGVGVVGGGVRVDGDAVGKGVVDGGHPVTVTDHGGDKGAPHRLGVQLPLRGADQFVLAVAEADGTDDLDVVFVRPVFIVQRLLCRRDVVRRAVAHHHDGEYALVGVLLPGVVFLDELHLQVAQFAQPVLPDDLEVDVVGLHLRTLRGEAAAVGPDDARLGVPGVGRDTNQGLVVDLRGPVVSGQLQLGGVGHVVHVRIRHLDAFELLGLPDGDLGGELVDQKADHANDEERDE